MSTPSRLPLAGIRVLDFTRVLSGPFCTALLGDLGAEIIKIEPPHGDDYRAVGPMVNQESAMFSVINRNKKSVVLDLKTDEGIAAVRKLAERADIVVENFRPGVAEKLGIGYADLHRANPALVYVSISGFGQDGPAARRPAYDIIIQAMSGMMEATGSPDGPPTLVGEAMSDVLSGLFASWGALVALYARERDGKGTHVDVSMFESTLAFMATSVSRYLFTGKPAARTGNRHPLSAPFGVYQAKDGHFVLAILNNKLFRQFAETIAMPQLAADPRFASDELRAANEPSLREAIETWSRGLTVDEVTHALECAAIPAAPIWNVQQALDFDQANHRAFLKEVDDDRLPGLRLPTQPLKFSGFGANLAARAPRLGEHTEEVLAGLIGYSSEKIRELQAACAG
ncbi:CaiB/BaiF CoA transferase family protein [Noviherbaspirillum denitrificans]|nr:CoA transferase [Noviherbaspirillum denitrificans]